jgi:hypothetical protein
MSPQGVSLALVAAPKLFALEMPLEPLEPLEMLHLVAFARPMAGAYA